MAKLIAGILTFLVLLVAGFFAYCTVADQDVKEKHCECIGYDCGCCSRLEVKHILDGKLCSNFSYLPDQYGISATITYNDRTIYNETISARNPPPICIIHIDKLQMEICLHFYKLDFKNKCFSGCAEFEVSFFHFLPLKKLELGCFGCLTSTSLTSEFQSLYDYFKYKTKQTPDEPHVVLI